MVRTGDGTGGRVAGEPEKEREIQIHRRMRVKSPLRKPRRNEVARPVKLLLPQ